VLRLAVCSFFERPADGAVFGAHAIPLHVTLMGNFGFNGAADAVVPAMSAMAGSLPITVTVGADAQFGPRGDVPVSIVVESNALRELHDGIYTRLRRLPISAEEPQYTGDGFRPHITRVAGSQVRSGQSIRLDSLSLVDLRPNGVPDLRRVLATVVSTEVVRD
jgi:2'-5' RNA ligase